MYEIFFKKRLERRYKSLYEIDIREENSKYDVGYPRSVVYSFLHCGCKTIGDIKDMIPKASIIKGLGESKLKIAIDMVNKYSDEAIIDITSINDVLTYSCIGNEITVQPEDDTSFDYYVNDINHFITWSNNLKDIDFYIVTLIRFINDLNVVINLKEPIKGVSFTNELKCVSLTEKDYYTLLDNLNEDIEYQERRKEFYNAI